MKKYFIILLAFSLIMAACGKSFLEKQPRGRISKEELFKDMDGLRAALNGAYNRVATYYSGHFTMYADVAGDHVKMNPSSTSSMLIQYNYQSNPTQELQAVGYIWQYVYEAMDNTNNVINSIPSLRSAFPESAAELNLILGQALILRAVCHWDLSKVYAQTYTYTDNASHLGVPTLQATPNPGQPVGRKTMKETYDFIIKDLKDAEKLLKQYDAPDNFTASYESAWALLSRIYLYMGDWDQSLAYSDSIILKGGFNLVPAANYVKMYTSWDVNNEVIWQLYYNKYTASNIAGEYANQITANGKLKDLFDQDDMRLNIFDGDFTKKYGRGFNGGSDNWPVNPKVVRLAEIYLNRAEALWHKKDYSGAADDVRIVAQRAHADVVTIPSDPVQLLQFIEDERSRELCFEGHRLFDITRRHQDLARNVDCNSTVCSLAFPNDRFILPIPQNELDVNTAMQPNPGVN